MGVGNLEIDKKQGKVLVSLNPKIYPLDVTLGRDKWDSIRTAILNIWKLAPDYILSV